MIDEQRNTKRTAVDNHRKLQFSLRRLLLRLCNDIEYFPRPLFLPNIEMPLNARPKISGSFGDIYLLENSPYGRVALKTFRLFGDEVEVSSMKKHKEVCIPRLRSSQYV